MINQVFRKKVNTNYLKEYSNSLKQNNSIIEIQDFGAGSRKNKGNKRKVSQIYRISSSSTSKADLIKRVCEYEMNSFIFLELGTNLGITSYAVAKSSKCDRLITIEGCPNLYQFTKNKLESFSNIKMVNEKFDSVLKPIIQKEKPNIIYIDGNHSYEATIEYFNIIKDFENVELIIFDDINWSKGMRKAWDEIKIDQLFNVSIDIFKMGLLYRREGQKKEDFILRY